ncbi:hypothetical protein CARUB_v10012135mg [Capsella rubella]|uniref:Pentacotripeptide-repeat region of PRORP domain-containing protein n=1 Tax=Capsella rubella TaxID=81985 RepID=R0IKU4_9BRAS|nr:hypothetical protein CARUB_v10012135mg [Capsella rubella]
MQRLGGYAVKEFFSRRTPWIRFARTLTTSEKNDTLHSWVMGSERRWLKVTPLLDKWLKQGKDINPNDLRGLIDALCESQRFNHALQVSEWVTSRGIFDLSSKDFASRLYLVEIHSGLREAEKFFINIPENMRDDSVYITLLSLYTKSKKTRHEAEATYQKMREQNMLLKPYPYYKMFSLYSLLGESHMIDEILRQMKENGVEHDKDLTVNNVLTAYASVPDVEAMDKFLMGIEVEDPSFSLAWQTGISIAKAYLNGGSSEKTVEMLRRTELVVDTKSKDSANKVLMEMYRDAGAKHDESRLYRLIYPNSNLYRLIYPNSKKGKSMGAYKRKEGDSSHVTYYYLGGGGCGSHGDGGSRRSHDDGDGGSRRSHDDGDGGGRRSHDDGGGGGCDSHDDGGGGGGGCGGGGGGD